MKYHFEVGIPAHLKTKWGVIPLTYSQHAKREARGDRYLPIRLPAKLDTNAAKVIEVETEGDVVTKVLYRVPYDTEHDLVLAVMPRQRFVRTVWLNRKSDTHKTLKREEYDRTG